MDTAAALLLAGAELELRNPAARAAAKLAHTWVFVAWVADGAADQPEREAEPWRDKLVNLAAALVLCAADLTVQTNALGGQSGLSAFRAECRTSCPNIRAPWHICVQKRVPSARTWTCIADDELVGVDALVLGVGAHQPTGGGQA